MFGRPKADYKIIFCFKKIAKSKNTDCGPQYKGKDKKSYYSKETKEIPKDSDYLSVIKKEKKANITPENIDSLMLSQIPGVSFVYAQGILENFSNLKDFIDKLAAEMVNN